MPIDLTNRKPGLEFIGLAWLATSSLVWLINGGPNWLPILIILIYVGFGIFAGHHPFRRTPFDLALLMFGLTALVGVWAAYQREAAWDKFWMLTLAALFYYGIASQPQENSWLMIGLICILGVLLSLQFLFLYDWRTLSADFSIITRIGLAWMAMRPVLHGQALMPNISAGILAGFFPFSLALGITAWRRQHGVHRLWLPVILAVCFSGVMALAIFMTSSRGAWFALVMGLGAWLAMSSGEKYLVHLSRRGKLALIYSGIAIFVFASVVFFALISDPAHILDLAPGLPTGQSRLGIDRLTLRLISDFPFTGGGLRAFAGLFSQYMLDIPNVMFKYSHNLYLDVALEQGILGLLALLAILGASILLLLRAPVGEDNRLGLNMIRQAALASLLVMIIHGTIDNPLHGERGTPFVWVISGLAVFMYPEVRSITNLLPFTLDRWSKLGGFQRRIWLSFLLIALPVVTYAVFNWRPLAGGWLANLGAVQMAQAQLINFPTNQWNTGDTEDSLTGAQDLFEQAVSLDPANRTANHRLGLIAMSNRDFETAIDYLDVAYRRDPEHRGVIKNLGYAFVWAGEFEKAQALLTDIPEAKQELEVYAWWWGVQGRPDLAQSAEEMVNRLEMSTELAPVFHLYDW